VGAAPVAVLATGGGLDISVFTELFGVHLSIRDLQLSSRGRSQKAAWTLDCGVEGARPFLVTKASQVRQGSIGRVGTIAG
jgi:hypothetical protein